MFFQGAFDGTVKISRNIARKSKNTEILNFFKNGFFDFFFSVRIDAPMSNLDVACSGTPPKHPKNPILNDFLIFFMFFISFI